MWLCCSFGFPLNCDCVYWAGISRPANAITIKREKWVTWRAHVCWSCVVCGSVCGVVSRCTLLFVRAQRLILHGFGFSAICISLEEDRFACFEFSHTMWFVTWFYGCFILPFFHDWVGFIKCPLSVAGKRLPVSVVVIWWWRVSGKKKSRCSVGLHRTSATSVCAIRWAPGIPVYPGGSEGLASCPCCL